MTLVVIAKCVDGLVLAADSKQTLVKVRENRPAPVDSGAIETEKLFHLKEPQNYVGILSSGYGAVNAGFVGANGYAKLDRYSIGSCVERFESELQSRGERRLTVAEFQADFETFLIKYWERYREQRVSEVDRMKRQIERRGLSEGLETLAAMKQFFVNLLVAGYDESEQDGHVLPIALSDADECWQGSRCIPSPSTELIPATCGIFCNGVEDFVIPVLTEDDPVESIKKLQRGSTEATIAKIIDMKTRFAIEFVNRQPSFFSSDNLTTHDGKSLAQLLIKGTTDFVGPRGPVGGRIRTCTIDPITGIKCGLHPQYDSHYQFLL